MTGRTYRFSEDQRLALRWALGSDSPGPFDEVRVVKRLERYVTRYQRKAGELEEPSAWVTADEALKVREQAAALGKTLTELRRQNARRITRYLGQEYSIEDCEGAVIERGKEVMGECGTLMDDMCSAADRAYEKAVQRALDSDERSERAFRKLCVNVGIVWHDVTEKSLPILKREDRAQRFEDAASDSKENLLWIVLNAIGIELTDITVQHIVKYTNGELFGVRDEDGEYS